ncbi:MAG: glycosyltransferase family 4 protein [Candidatus Diapherotrites archaeon]|nr:glycosyltransferase family 4 protein [Candidatus Diapherotrites archaeon]
MVKVLLTHESFSAVKAGQEVYSEQLKKAFPDLEILNFQNSKTFSQLEWLSVLREPLHAKAVQDHFVKELNSLNPELVFVNGMFGWNLNNLKKQIPIIGINHGTFSALADCSFQRNLNYFRTRYLYSWFEKKSFQNCSKIVSNSSFSDFNLKKYYHLNSTVIGNAIDAHMFNSLNKEKMRMELNLPLDKKIILFVGRADYSKGFDVVKQLMDLHKDCLFVCITFPKIFVHKSNVLCVNPMEQSQLAKYYSASDVVVFPSRFEGFGYVSIEALACNIPVVAYFTGIVQDLNHPLLYKVQHFSVANFSKGLNYALAHFPEKDYSEIIRTQFGLPKFIQKFQNLAKTII